MPFGDFDDIYALDNPSEVFRAAGVQALVGQIAADQAGVYGPDSFAATAGTGRTWDLTGGRALIHASGAPDGGLVAVRRVDPISVESPPGDATDPRYDRIWLRIEDESLGDAPDSLDGHIELVSGTPAASPSPPAVPDNALLLYTILIPAAWSASDNNDLDGADNRVADGFWRLPRGEVGYAQRTSPTAPTADSRLVITDLAVDLSALPAGRIVRVTFHWRAVNPSSSDFATWNIHIQNGTGTSGTVLSSTRIASVSTAALQQGNQCVWRGVDPPDVIAPSFVRIGGSGTVELNANPTSPMFLLAEDIGGTIPGAVPA